MGKFGDICSFTNEIELFLYPPFEDPVIVIVPRGSTDGIVAVPK